MLMELGGSGEVMESFFEVVFKENGNCRCTRSRHLHGLRTQRALVQKLGNSSLVYKLGKNFIRMNLREQDINF